MGSGEAEREEHVDDYVIPSDFGVGREENGDRLSNFIPDDYVLPPDFPDFQIGGTLGRQRRRLRPEIYVPDDYKGGEIDPHYDDHEGEGGDDDRGDPDYDQESSDSESTYEPLESSCRSRRAKRHSGSKGRRRRPAKSPSRSTGQRRLTKDSLNDIYDGDDGGDDSSEGQLDDDEEEEKGDDEDDEEEDLGLATTGSTSSYRQPAAEVVEAVISKFTIVNEGERQVSLPTHFQQWSGGKRSKTSAMTIMKRLALFLCFAHEELMQEPLQADEVYSFMITLVTEEYAVVEVFTDYSLSIRDLQPATVKNIILHIILGVKWYFVFSRIPGMMQVPFTIISIISYLTLHFIST